VILVIGLLVFALGVYLVGGNRERSDMAPVLAEQQRVLREKDEKIQSLEAQLAQLRQDRLGGGTDEIAELKSKITASQKDLTTARAQLRDANREIDRLAASRIAAAQRPTPRNADSQPAPAAPSAARSRRVAEPGLYETMRATSVYQKPASSSRVMSQISKGTQITVIRSAGDWLEIRSKHGNPSGFIRADDATFLSRAN
jgi:TolA-binding protein